LALLLLLLLLLLRALLRARRPCRDLAERRNRKRHRRCGRDGVQLAIGSHADYAGSSARAFRTDTRRATLPRDGHEWGWAVAAVERHCGGHHRVTADIAGGGHRSCSDNRGELRPLAA
jgi:hypothetical protein